MKKKKLYIVRERSMVHAYLSPTRPKVEISGRTTWYYPYQRREQVVTAGTRTLSRIHTMCYEGFKQATGLNIPVNGVLRLAFRGETLKAGRKK